MAKLWLDDYVQETYPIHAEDLNRDYKDELYLIAKHNEDGIFRDTHGSSGLMFN